MGGSISVAGKTGFVGKQLELKGTFCSPSSDSEPRFRIYEQAIRLFKRLWERAHWLATKAGLSISTQKLWKGCPLPPPWVHLQSLFIAQLDANLQFSRITFPGIANSIEMEDAVFGVIFEEDLDKENHAPTSQQVLAQNVDKVSDLVSVLKQCW